MKLTTNSLRAIIIEFLGTFVIAFVTFWSFGLYRNKLLGYLDMALIQGMIIGSMTWAGLAFSGAHFNPTITILKACLQEISVPNACVYVAVQMLASFFGALLAILTSVVQEKNAPSISFPHPEPGYTQFQCFFLEFFASFVLVLVYSATVLDRKAPSNIFGFAIGAVYALSFLAIGGSTGGCVNPIKVFGGHLVLFDFTNSGIYWLSTVTGGVFAGFYYDFFLRSLEADVDAFEDLDQEQAIETEK